MVWPFFIFIEVAVPYSFFKEEAGKEQANGENYSIFETFRVWPIVKTLFFLPFVVTFFLLISLFDFI